jgi:hypothetical protein
MSTEYIGPFSDNFRILVDGYSVPYVEAYQKEADTWTLVLDHRFSVDATGEEVQKWLWWIANAMAIAAGYSCHGENSEPLNRYKCKVMGLSQDELREMNE